MRDLGTLGGTCALATGVNNAGIVIGDNINDEPTERAFLWENGSIRDLGGTIGGNQTTAEALNQAGQVAGVGTLAGELFYHATLWKRLGEITDLGTVDQDPCSFSSAINSKAQIVGASLPGCAFDSNTRAFLWEDGSIFDLNTLISPGASLHLQWARDINDRGEIAGTGLDAEGNAHDFLLMPCGANGPSDCKEEISGATTGTRAIRAPLTHGRQFTNPGNSIRQMLRRGLGPMPHILTPKAGVANNSQMLVTKTNNSTGQR